MARFLPLLRLIGSYHCYGWVLSPVVVLRRSLQPLSSLFETFRYDAWLFAVYFAHVIKSHCYVTPRVQLTSRLARKCSNRITFFWPRLSTWPTPWTLGCCWVSAKAGDGVVTFDCHERLRHKPAFSVVTKGYWCKS